MRKLSILGSTGSIGTSTLDVVDSFSDTFRVAGLAAGRNVELLAEQVRRYRPEVVSVRDEEGRERLRALLGRELDAEVLCGDEGLRAVATLDGVETVIAGIVGAAGLVPVHAALEAGKRVGFANKEVLVVAGDLVIETARKNGGEILPVDSEHNAVHQALRCGDDREVARIILTASGGPFLRRDLSTFDDITVEAALAHPTWKMGNKISIDSATMMNKGLEVIEAHHLFGRDADAIDILIHPQSIVHSMVEYVDGSILAQMSVNDMKFPIQYALTYPERVPCSFERLDLRNIARLEFLEVDHQRFPAVALAYEACRTGGSMPAVLNAANEVAVDRFLRGEIAFSSIVRTVSRVMERHANEVAPIASLDDAFAWDAWARNAAAGMTVEEVTA